MRLVRDGASEYYAQIDLHPLSAPRSRVVRDVRSRLLLHRSCVRGPCPGRGQNARRLPPRQSDPNRALPAGAEQSLPLRSTNAAPARNALGWTPDETESSNLV